jgi:Holliday junction DNA helicase RuvA
VIGKVSGRLDARGTDHVLIDTGGVGYVVFCSDRTLAALPEPGGRVALYTELVVREDLMQLFGFLTLAEREWHRLLTSVQGVGARGALAILGTLGADGVARALSLGDTSAIRAAPGIGPKIAQRLILELRAKAPAVMALGAAGAQRAMVSDAYETPPEQAPTAAPAAQMAARPDLPDPALGAAAQADALSALVHLGYAQGEAAAAVAEASGAAESSVEAAGAEALIRAALRRLAPQG